MTQTARQQYRGMVSRYLRTTQRRPARPNAARRFIETYDEASQMIGAGPRTRLTSLPPVITNSFDEVGDMPGQISANDTPAAPA